MQHWLTAHEPEGPEEESSAGREGGRMGEAHGSSTKGKRPRDRLRAVAAPLSPRHVPVLVPLVCELHDEQELDEDKDEGSDGSHVAPGCKRPIVGGEAPARV